MLYSTQQCYTAYNNVIQQETMLCITQQCYTAYNVIQHTTMLYSTQQCYTADNNVIQHTTMLYSIQQCCTAYNNVIQHTTMLYSIQQCYTVQWLLNTKPQLRDNNCILGYVYRVAGSSESLLHSYRTLRHHIPTRKQNFNFLRLWS